MQEVEPVEPELHFNKIENNKIVHQAGHTGEGQHKQAVQGGEETIDSIFDFLVQKEDIICK